MSSAIASTELRPLKIALFSLIFIASVCAAAHYVMPHIREHNIATKQLNELKAGNAELEQKIAQLRKNKTEFQNNNLDFIILTGHREGLVGPNEKLFEFSEPAGKK